MPSPARDPFKCRVSVLLTDLNQVQPCFSRCHTHPPWVRVLCCAQEVQQVCASNWAFAARRRDGSVVTWGDADLGGDSSQAQRGKGPAN